jgi:hypothetical protein
MPDPAPELPAHPPSPRLRHVVRPPAPAPRRRGGYLGWHWRGELPLAAAVIVSAALVWGAVQLIQLASRSVTMTDHPVAAALLLVLEVAVLIAGALWWGVGVQRSAIASVDQGGSLFVALLSGAVGIGAFLWVGLFWLQSARHLVPDIWATVSGAVVPAAVTADAAAGLIVVTGDLEFGTARSVRAALDANPSLRTVRLESRGGRVAEGLALGKLLRDRGVDTLVTGECSSACVTAFAGGARRMITPQARLGLHSAGGRGASADAVAAANRRSDEFIAGRGVDWRVLEKGAEVSFLSIWFPDSGVLLASNLATELASRPGQGGNP